jgi:hypothetical protein
MKIHLIQGHFTSKDALSIVTKMIDVKIKFQEEKIKSSDNEEDIKMREHRIKSLQKELYDFRNTIEVSEDSVSLLCELNIG